MSTFRQSEGDGRVSVELDRLPLVKPGCYLFAFEQYRTALVYGRAPKVALRFRIIDPGPNYETQLDRWYNVKAIKGKPRKLGDFRIGRNSDFLREYLTLFPLEVSRLDRISFAPFRNSVIKGRVETVTHNAQQKPLPDPLQYSIIRELIEVAA